MKLEPPPKRGVPAPFTHPRTSIADPVVPVVMNKCVVLHCDSPQGFTGVYSPFQRGDFSICYMYDLEMTCKLVSEIDNDNMSWTALENRGFCFYFTPPTQNTNRMMAQDSNGRWCLETEFGCFVENQIPRSRCKMFWDDPHSLLCMNPSEIHSVWLEDTQGSPYEPRKVQIAITSLESLRRAVTLKSGPSTPIKYQRASDYSAWDRSFVLHVDPRTCQAPLSWIDLLTGVYLPIKGKMLNGYPIWERQRTTELASAMTDPVKEYLEHQGIRIDLSHSSSGGIQRLMYVRKDNEFSPSLLALTRGADMKDALRKRNVLEACHVPSNMTEILTEPASLFSSPDKAFSTWMLHFEGQWMETHVAFTPKDFFEQAITLTALDAELGDKYDGDSGALGGSNKKRKKKKKKKKKKSATSSPDHSPAANHPRGNDAEHGKAGSNEAASLDLDSTIDRAIPDIHIESKTKKKKKKIDEQEVIESTVNATEGILGKLAGPQQKIFVRELKDQVDYGEDKHKPAPYILEHLAALVEADTSSIPSTHFVEHGLSDIKSWSAEKALQVLLERKENSVLFADPLWLQFEDSVTSHILKAAATSDKCEWVKANASHLVIIFSKPLRKNDLAALLGVGASVSATAVAVLLRSLPRDRGDQFNNKIVKILCANCEITMDSREDEFGEVMHAASHVVGKATKKELVDVLKKASAELQKSKKQRIRERKVESSRPIESPIVNHTEEVQENKAVDVDPGNKLIMEGEILKATEKIKAALIWYNDLLDDLLMKASSIQGKPVHGGEQDLDPTCVGVTSTVAVKSKLVDKPKVALTSEEVANALSICDTEDALANVETSFDLFQWDSHSAWTIDITEQAHKWFHRHIKKDRPLCERIIRRLTLLSTGRWPYVLAKPLRTKKIGSNSKKINLYETKIDSASRIIWEVAIAFSPRRSGLDQNFCEQVIRVWDVALDHDNLDRAIALTIERIEKSHLRGEDCAIYAELDKSQMNNSQPSKDSIGVTRIPRVFPMSNEVTLCSTTRGQTPEGRSRHFHPASDDPRQFTLLKFYELNAGAIKILLDGNNESMDLPFTPGPKEHAIIHHQSVPQRSILLMGRSGTGKTTCLVFRMWAQHASYTDGEAAKLQQLFLTKNDVLCREVERSFNNMGLAWRKREGQPGLRQGREKDGVASDGKVSDDSKQTQFMTSSQWLEALDSSLPGEKFFRPQELEQRVDNRKQKDTVTEGVEALLSDGTDTERENVSCRQELTFPTFRKLRRKIWSGSGSQIDCTLVWREIKSFIKGSVTALHIGKEDRSQKRYLSLDEYLALPRKQSRMDEIQRTVVYDLFLRYEKIKKKGGYYDECDLVYNIAGRISFIDQINCDEMNSGDMNMRLGVLPVDSLFVDEVQDWTQAELFVLAKTCRDSNNLFLAGDTAQSIAVGVDFRFTDVRQLFYQFFEGVEPELLQLSHNYRSHSGVLRLAACVVELLYFFFSNSLDRLPPDLGLFSGPKPVIMEVTSTADLILMLDGAKRETSRIEFGAHQVVIVRSEEAKKDLPDEFGVDRDWVMTVQQSKGLEFDDVLLYNFFSDSPAKDAWRVVSNYTEEDIDNYYSDISVASSGVQKYDWDTSFLNKTRHLDFSKDQHKILETELKMLYTAITRARVNVFIAETNLEMSRPMFNYFQRRAVVDVVNKDKPDDVSSVRVFGVMDNVDDWRSRGEYYLRNSEGERQKGCLRLAAKCFDKSGDVKRRDFALAFLAFTEIEEQDFSKRRAKHEWREGLYNITSQLLEARDIGFLNKAALCLLRTGEHDIDAARMFELYARICYTQRISSTDGTVSSPSLNEKRYFSYAGKLFAKCIKSSDKRVAAIDSFRCYLCAGMYDDAAQLISSCALPLQDGETFEQLNQLCLASNELERDPIVSFQKEFQESADRTLLLKGALNKAAKVRCRVVCKDGGKGFSAALRLLSLRSDRIELLSTIDSGADLVLSKKPWGSHPLFTQATTSDDGKGGIDPTTALVSDLKLEGRFREVITILEDRGLLLEAATQLDELLTTEQDTTGMSAAKSMALRAKFVELMLLLPNWKETKESLASILDRQCISAHNSADMDTRCSSLLSSAILADDPAELLSVVRECNGSILWQHRALQLAFDQNSNEYLLVALPGDDVSERLAFIYELASKLTGLASALRNPSTRTLEDNLLVSHAERHFELTQKKMDPSQVETKPVMNSRLREVLHLGQCSLPFSSSSYGTSLGFTQSINREKMHMMLSRFIFYQAALLLVKLSDLAWEYGQQKRYLKPLLPIADLREYVHCLQLHLLCKKDAAALFKSEGKRGPSTMYPWKIISQIKEGGPAASDLREVLFSERRVAFVIDDGNLMQRCDTKTRPPNAIGIKASIIDGIYSTERFSRMPIERKKCDIKHTMDLWRLRSLHKSIDFASEELHKDIGQLEKHVSTKRDIKSKRRHYFINKKYIFPRLWLWVVESSNLMNSIKVTERIINTSFKDRRLSMSKQDQVSLLEVNLVALFSSLSLRYSEVRSPPMLIPKFLYLKGLLTGETGFPQLHGFGAPLKNVLSAYCDKYFYKVFQDVVTRIEESAAIILSSGLLSPVKEDGVFEKAFCLSSFLCCNAILFSTAGVDMDLKDYNRDQSNLPALPLQGNVKKLVANLEKQIMSSIDSPKLSFLDLATYSDNLLKSSMQDHFVLCRLKQLTEHAVAVEVFEDTSNVLQSLSNIPLDPRSNFFENSVTKNIAFLDNADTGYDEGEQGQKSDELNAVKQIARFIKARSNKESVLEASAAIMHFRRWKVAMRIFIRLLRKWTAKKAYGLHKDIDVHHQDVKCGIDNNCKCILTQIFNPFQDNNVFHQRKEMLKSSFDNAVVDDIECTYCCMAFNPEVQRDRSAQWNLGGRMVPYLMFCQHFNQTNFATGNISSPGLASHTQHVLHQDNAVHYTTKLNEFATVMARISMGIELLFEIVNSCEEKRRGEDIDIMWYLNTAEESRALITCLENAQQDLGNAGVEWSRTPSHDVLWKIMHDVSGLPNHAESFFMKQMGEEISLKKRRLDETTVMNVDVDEVNENPIEELLRGPYLNPDAHIFVPQFG